MVRLPSGGRLSVQGENPLSILASRRDGMPTVVDYFRHQPPPLAAARRAQTAPRAGSHLILQDIFNSAPGEFQVGTRLAMPSYQRGSHSLMNLSWTKPRQNIVYVCGE
jgi:hypothetical protein